MKKRIAGFTCDLYRVVTQRGSSETCYIPWGTGVVTKDDLHAFQLLDDMLSILSGDGAVQGWARLLDAPGFPAWSADASGREWHVVESIERAAIATSESTIETPELRSLRSAAEQGELLPERQVLESDVRAGSERSAQGAQQSEKMDFQPCSCEGHHPELAVQK